MEFEGRLSEIFLEVNKKMLREMIKREKVVPLYCLRQLNSMKEKQQSSI
jgi:hypothetical protein